MPETSKHEGEPPGRAQIDAFLRVAVTPPDEELLHRYRTAKASLTEAERSKVEANLAFNPHWQEAERRLVTEEEQKREGRPAFTPLRFLRPRTLLDWAVAATIVLLALYGILWFASRATLSESYSLASVSEDPYESRLIETVRRSENGPRGDFERGAAALLAAPRSTLGLFPHYDPVQADSAVLYLERAFEATTEAFQRAEIAFFLGKAYLMHENTTAARDWLNRSLDQNVSVYREDAQELLVALDTR